MFDVTMQVHYFMFHCYWVNFKVLETYIYQYFISYCLLNVYTFIMNPTYRNVITMNIQSSFPWFSRIREKHGIHHCVVTLLLNKQLWESLLSISLLVSWIKTWIISPNALHIGGIFSKTCERSFTTATIIVFEKLHFYGTILNFIITFVFRIKEKLHEIDSY